jgi:hypothetical protein
MALTLKQAGTVKSNKLTTSFPTRSGSPALKNGFTAVRGKRDPGAATRTSPGRHSSAGKRSSTADPAVRSRTIVPATGGLLTPH